MGRLVTMLVAAGGSVAVGTWAMQHALTVRGRAQEAAVAQAAAAEAVQRAADAAAASGSGASAAGSGTAEGVEPPRPQGGFQDGAPPPAFDLSRHESLTPRDAKVDRATGERVAPFHGFGVSVDSTPGGARVLAGGVELGETPLVASIACEPGATVVVRVEKAGFGAWSARTRCRRDALVSLDARLRR
jgi:hypothetical protein